MLGPQGACPSVPLRSSHQDVRALVALLQEMGALAPRCRTARISAIPETHWEDVAVVAEAVRFGAGYENPQFAVREGGEASPQCDGGMRPGTATP